MNTGFKKLYRKISLTIKHPNFFLKKEELDRFPKNSSPRWKIKLQLYSLSNTLKEWNLKKKIGALHCQPHPISISVWKKLLPYNPNNLGNWSLANQKRLHGPQKIERQLIKAMINLYGGNPKSWEGYVTTGATESNIFSAWAGRNFLKNFCKMNQVCLVNTSLTHYSISKAADVVNIQTFSTKLNRETWSIDLDNLEKTVGKLYKKGYKSFLVPLTLGYTQTGTNDDYQAIIKLLKKLEKTFKIAIFVWIDAALNGLILPFTRENFFPLENSKVQAFCVDFHKTGMTPIPCGIVLYRRSLRENIENPIPYIHENDNTLLGSRSGISPVAVYSIISLLGKRGFKKVIRKGQYEKRKFKQIMSSALPNVEITDDQDGVSIGLISKTPLPQDFLSKYGLYTKKSSYSFKTGIEKLYIYKASFLPRF